METSSARPVPSIPLVGRTLEEAVGKLLLAALMAVVPAAALAAEVERVPPNELRRLQLVKDDGFVLIDVRPPGVFNDGHIQGAVNVPLDAVPAWQPPSGKKIVVYCPSTACPADERAAETLLGRGIGNVALLDGGFADWSKAGYPVAKAKREVKAVVGEKVSAVETKALIEAGGVLVLDVRPAGEFSAGHLPGAVNIPLEDLSTRLAEVEGKVLVYDRKSRRSRDAAKVLEDAGRTVSLLKGGLLGWAARKFPLEVK